MNKFHPIVLSLEYIGWVIGKQNVGPYELNIEAVDIKLSTTLLIKMFIYREASNSTFDQVAVQH